MTPATANIETPVAPRGAKPRRKKEIPGITRPMTYEEYLASPEEMARYDILDGWKVYRKYGAKQLANPTRNHQVAQGELFVAFRAYSRAARTTQALMAPCDVLTQRNPTRSRQPDVLLISQARLAQNLPADDPSPLSPAPELVVEILSPSDTRRVQAAKLADYARVEVLECWLVSLEAGTVEVMRNENGTWVTASLNGQGQTVMSVAFPGLVVAVDDLFAAE